MANRIMGPPEMDSNAPKPGFADSIKALKLLIPFFKMVWKTSPPLTLANVLLRLIKSGVPLAQLFIGKLIIDEIVQLVNKKGDDYNTLWKWIAIEFSITLLSEVLSRLINLVDSLLGDLYGNFSSIELMNKAATIDPVSYTHLISEK